ncbi:hypothetical protein D9M70_502420 [compost metagenome]
MLVKVEQVAAEPRACSSFHGDPAWLAAGIGAQGDFTHGVGLVERLVFETHPRTRSAYLDISQALSMFTQVDALTNRLRLALLFDSGPTFPGLRHCGPPSLLLFYIQASLLSRLRRQRHRQ